MRPKSPEVQTARERTVAGSSEIPASGTDGTVLILDMLQFSDLIGMVLSLTVSACAGGQVGGIHVGQDEWTDGRDLHRRRALRLREVRMLRRRCHKTACPERDR